MITRTDPPAASAEAEADALDGQVARAAGFEQGDQVAANGAFEVIFSNDSECLAEARQHFASRVPAVGE